MSFLLDEVDPYFGHGSAMADIAEMGKPIPAHRTKETGVPQRRFTDDLRRDIGLHEGTQSEIARYYGVSLMTVYRCQKLYRGGE